MDRRIKLRAATQAEPKRNSSRAPKVRIPESDPEGAEAHFTNLAAEALGTLGVCAIMGAKVTGNRVLVQDGQAVIIHSGNAAPALGKAASQSEIIATCLNYFAMVTPVAAIAQAVLPMVTQIVVNHKYAKTDGREIDAVEEMAGAIPPAELENGFKAQMQQAAAQLRKAELIAQLEAENEEADMRALLDRLQAQRRANEAEVPKSDDLPDDE